MAAAASILTGSVSHLQIIARELDECTFRVPCVKYDLGICQNVHSEPRFKNERVCLVLTRAYLALAGGKWSFPAIISSGNIRDSPNRVPCPAGCC
jgi:hypothetical protein